MATIDFDNVRLTTAGGIPYKRVSGPTYYEDREKASAQERIIIPALALDEFMAEALPAPIIIADLIVIDPARRLPGAAHLITKSVSMTPVDESRPIDPFGSDLGAGALNQDEWERTYGALVYLDITYETGVGNEDEENEPDSNDPVTFLEHSLSAGVEYLSIPPTKLEEAEGEDPEANQQSYSANRDQQLGAFKLIPTVEHTLKWKWALRPNWTTIYETLGKVNDRPIKIFNRAKKEHVLFTGLSGSQSYRLFRSRRNQKGLIVDPWSLEFRFSQRTINDGGEQYGWNHVYSPKKGKWVKIKREDTGRFLYEDADMNAMFKADPDNNPDEEAQPEEEE